MQTYSVGFKIFDALSLQTEDGGSCDPFVVAECCGRRYQTSTQEQVTTIAVWNDSCIWPDIELYEKEFESAYIEFSIYSRYWFTRNYCIGKASLQLAFINNRPNRLYARRWLSLRREGSTDVQGMLNVSVFCLKSGQQAPSATEQETLPEAEETEGGDDGLAVDDLSKAVLVNKMAPPAGRPHMLIVSIHRVEDMASLGRGGWPAPFVTVEFCGCLVKTHEAPECENYSFQDAAKIPVMTPVYEDTILVKLWSHNWFSPDELLAQGLISFSELRNNALSAQWFNLYGWDANEIPDVSKITATGEPVKPNHFKGRILISGRVDRLDPDLQEELQPACRGVAMHSEEPAQKQVAIFADVYAVVGAPGRSCKVEICYGKDEGSSLWSYDTKAVELESSKEGNVNTEEEVMGHFEEVASFRFTQQLGRVEPLLVMTPESPGSQPYVMVNIYTAGLLAGEARVGFCMHKLNDFPSYEQGSPARPKFLALEPMPGAGFERVNASVLVTIEHNNTRDVVRHNRKEVSPMLYIVRAYCFMARNIKYSEGSDVTTSYALRITCAGMSIETETRQEVRPMWMQHRDLKVILFSDTWQDPPTVEPITVTLSESRAMGYTDIGKATCIYTHMRQKDKLKNWEPYHLKPQWISVYGGAYGQQPVGEVLVAFELLQWKHREHARLLPRDMWPASDEDFNKEDHYCRLKKATLHFSLLGLRDIFHLPRSEIVGNLFGTVAVENPRVTVELPSFRSSQEKSPPSTQPLVFNYEKYVKGKEQSLQESQLRKWDSKIMRGSCTARNFEYFAVGKVNVEIPDRMMLQPYLRIRVEEMPSEGGVIGGMLGPTLIGESLRSLHNLLPCCWLEGVSLDKTYSEQKSLIRERLEQARVDEAVRPHFVQQTRLEMQQEFAEERKEQLASQKVKSGALIVPEVEPPVLLDNTALPLQLRQLDDTCKRPLRLQPVRDMNMQREKEMSPRIGEADLRAGEAGARGTVHSNLEDSPEFMHDFWYRNCPLLRNRDIVDIQSEEGDWNYRPGVTFGFVKCQYKLVDGWEVVQTGEDDGDDIDAQALQDEADDAELEVALDHDLERLKRSFEFSTDLNKCAFHQGQLIRKFKSHESIPSRIRVRIYLVKAICIFAKGTGIADPYVEFQLGRNIHVSMKNLRERQSNQPNFYRMEERDIEFPDDARLEISIMDYEELAIYDTNIGSTVIDLEDRWHSKKWAILNHRQQVPIENRSLFNAEVAGKNRGNIEMWIEMLDSVQASDVKPLELRPPPSTEIEVRIVVRTARIFTLDEGDLCDLCFGFYLKCDEYGGEQNPYQETDVHYGCSGKAVYNYRIVYPKLKMPVQSVLVDVSLLKHNHMAANEMVGFLTLDLKRYVEKVARDLDVCNVDAAELKFSSGNAVPGEEAQQEEEEECPGTVTLELSVISDVEAQTKPANIARLEPNQYPQLVAPTEGRGWDAVFSSLGIAWPDLALWKLMLPPVLGGIAFLGTAVVMKQIGLF